MPENTTLEAEPNPAHLSAKFNFSAMREKIDAEAVVRSTLNEYWKFLINSGLPVSELPSYKLSKTPAGFYVARILFSEEKSITWTLSQSDTSRVEIRDRFSYLKLNLHPHEVLHILKEYAY